MSDVPPPHYNLTQPSFSDDDDEPGPKRRKTSDIQRISPNKVRGGRRLIGVKFANVGNRNTLLCIIDVPGRPEQDGYTAFARRSLEDAASVLRAAGFIMVLDMCVDRHTDETLRNNRGYAKQAWLVTADGNLRANNFALARSISQTFVDVSKHIQ